MDFGYYVGICAAIIVTGVYLDICISKAKDKILEEIRKNEKIRKR